MKDLEARRRMLLLCQCQHYRGKKKQEKILSLFSYIKFTIVKFPRKLALKKLTAEKSVKQSKSGLLSQNHGPWNGCRGRQHEKSAIQRSK